MKPDLKIVRGPKTESQPYDEQKGLRRIQMLQSQLLAASVRYVLEGTTDKPQDRVRKASDVSGIPRSLIEIEADKGRTNDRGWTIRNK
jgi:hypothetical protein